MDTDPFRTLWFYKRKEKILLDSKIDQFCSNSPRIEKNNGDKNGSRETGVSGAELGIQAIGPWVEPKSHSGLLVTSMSGAWRQERICVYDPDWLDPKT